MWSCPRALILCQEVAQNFKEQGNEYYKSKRYREALGFYTQGVDAKPIDAALEESLLSNRAACNLELSASLIVIFVDSSDWTPSYRELWVCLARLLQGVGSESSIIKGILSLWPGLDGSG
jgi:hypothetical protein